MKGSIYKESGDTARAISSLVTATEQDNAFEDAFYDLGIIYAARKNPLAMEYYNSALRINPTNANILYARAKLLQDLGKIDEAIVEYESMILKNKECDQCIIWALCFWKLRTNRAKRSNILTVLLKLILTMRMRFLQEVTPTKN
jgi:tetratricopeptide (TPR) repeat protein